MYEPLTKKELCWLRKSIKLSHSALDHIVFRREYIATAQQTRLHVVLKPNKKDYIMSPVSGMKGSYKNGGSDVCFAYENLKKPSTKLVYSGAAKPLKKLAESALNWHKENLAAFKEKGGFKYKSLYIFMDGKSPFVNYLDFTWRNKNNKSSKPQSKILDLNGLEIDSACRSYLDAFYLKDALSIFKMEDNVEFQVCGKMAGSPCFSPRLISGGIYRAYIMPIHTRGMIGGSL